MSSLRSLGSAGAWPRWRRWAAGASLVWAVLVVAYGIGFFRVAPVSGRGTLFLDAMFFLVALTVPLLLVWLAVLLAEALDRQRELTAALAGVAGPLLAELAAVRTALERQDGADTLLPASAPAMADPSPRLDRLLVGQAKIEAALNRLRAIAEQPQRPARAIAAEAAAIAAAAAAAAPASPAPPPEPVADAAVETRVDTVAAHEEPEPAPDAAPEWADLVRALDFPRDANDQEGFQALRRALRHHGLAQMLQAAEDVLNLLSQEKVFVDELDMAPVDADAWRGFMAGVRGPEVAGVAGIRDEAALSVAQRLLQTDSIFRDSALFFQRRFDRVLAEFGKAASDVEIAEIAGTRSGRAFMMLVQLSGSLD